MQEQENAHRAKPPPHGKPETNLLSPGMETPLERNAGRGGLDADHCHGPNVDARPCAVPQPECMYLNRALAFLLKLNGGRQREMTIIRKVR